ncbi:MAG: hypothetical protein J6S49_06810 [Erysipelotrichaceae bacterium]|nr:hypothetical protein [Erysipelotrichaceae bacterium]
MYPIYPNPYQQMVTAPQQQTIQYVNGKQSAETYQIPANSSVILMDSNLPRFYMKQTDASGMTTIKAYDFKEAEVEKPQEYVTKQEFEKFKASMKGVKHESTNDANRKQ